MDPSGLTYDLAIAWIWKYDSDFVRLVESIGRVNSIRVLTIGVSSLSEAIEQLRKRTLHFKFFLDRASDEDESFQTLARMIQKRFREQEDPSTIRPFNPLDLLVRAADKATMHLEFLSNGINVPYTIIISPFNHRKEVELSLSELSKLGRPFIVKPANTTGGGIGVVTGAESLKDVIEARQHHRNDKYLLQETIKPAILGARRAWFRVFYAFEQILPCWWDDQTHIYEPLDSQGEFGLTFEELCRTTEKIYRVCKLDFFSTELVLTAEQKVVAVDYVNEMCDMRLQSVYKDGVPDSIVVQIVESLIQRVKKHKLQ